MDYKPVPCIVPITDFDASGDSQDLRAAMQGLSTNEQQIIEVLVTRSNAQRQQMIVSYLAEFDRDLIKDLKGELGAAFENVILALMLPPIEYLCRQLHGAMAGIGTNLGTLVEILCTKSFEEMQEIVVTYEKMFGRPLAEHLTSETSGFFRRLLVMVVTGVRDDQDTPVDPENAKVQAAKLYAGGEEKLGTDEEVLNRIMTHASFNQLRLVFDEYRTLAGQTMEHAIKNEITDELHEPLMAIVDCAQSPAGYFAKRLYKTMNGVGTDDKTLVRIIISRSEIDLETIKEEYERIFNRTLISALVAETSGDYRVVLIAMLGAA